MATLPRHATDLIKLHCVFYSIFKVTGEHSIQFGRGCDILSLEIADGFSVCFIYTLLVQIKTADGLNIDRDG